MALEPAVCPPLRSPHDHAAVAVPYPHRRLGPLEQAGLDRSRPPPPHRHRAGRQRQRPPDRAPGPRHRRRPRPGHRRRRRTADLGAAAIVGRARVVVARTVAHAPTRSASRSSAPQRFSTPSPSEPTDWVARIAPAQSHCWQVYADFLLAAGHTRIAVAAQPTAYWESGTRILRERLASRGATLIKVDIDFGRPRSAMPSLTTARQSSCFSSATPSRPCRSSRPSAPTRACPGILIGAPAGQPEFSEWAGHLGAEGSRNPVPELPPRSPHPARRPRRRRTPRASGRPAVIRRLRGLRHHRRPRRYPALPRTGPEDHRRVLVARLRRRHPRPHSVLARPRHQRLAVDLAAGPGRRPRPGRVLAPPRPLLDSALVNPAELV